MVNSSEAISENWSFMKNITFAFYAFLTGTPIMLFFEKYVFNDWDFLVNLSIILLFDTLFGATLALKERRFSATVGMKKIVVKILYIASGVMLVGAISKIRINGDSFFYEYANAGLFSILIGFESISALKNFYKLNPPLGLKRPIGKLISKISSFLDDDTRPTEGPRD